MDFLRRSVHTKDVQGPLISTPIPAVSRPTASIQPPKKVIRALQDHRPQAPHELGFTKGDFFHVINEIDQGPGWYEANNPVTGARGLVPKSKFEEFSKSNAALRVSQAAARTLPPKSPSIKSPILSPRQAVFYAVVQHDFVAERADELDAKAGDHISVVAQSNYEWFVAKPISRLGRPGLIPVSFVAIHDPSSGRSMNEDEIKGLMDRGDIPGVEEWKRTILEYKAASISLGVIDDESRGPVPNSPFMPQGSPKLNMPPPPRNVHAEPPRPSSPPSTLPDGLLLSANISSWHYEMNEYWFRIEALFQPDKPPDSDHFPKARNLLLFRVYNDFYDFQVNLLNLFPIEAGRESVDGRTEPKRILPYMPGPAQNVDDKVTDMRKDELDQYLVQLAGLWEFGAEHILRHKLIRDFFTPKAGDAEEDVEPAYSILESRRATEESLGDEEQIQEPFSKMSMKESGARYSDGSNYEEEPSFFSPSKTNGNANGANGYDRNVTSPTQTGTYGQKGYPHQRSKSPYTSTSRTNSPAPQRSGSTTSTRNYSAEAALSRSMSSYSQMRNNEQEQTLTYTSRRRPEDDSPHSVTSNPSVPPTATSAGSGMGGRKRSASTANTPQISANNPATAFIKIKIFDRITQELIAIRVNPRVTHAQLMEKVQSRLGNDVAHLAYRDSIANTFVGLDNDLSLKEWLDATDKHVLYAD